MGTIEVDTDIRTHTETVVQVEMRFSFTWIRGSLSTLLPSRSRLVVVGVACVPEVPGELC